MSVKKLLDSELARIKPSSEEQEYLENLTNLFIQSIKKRISKKKIKADVFLGGSLAKDTLIKKEKYDVDLFIRFEKRYSEQEIKKQMKRIFFWFRVPKQRIRIRRIHGSRDYYKIILKKHKNIVFEIVPTVKITKPEQARNITDLSYFHVNYLKNKISKNTKLRNEILLAKSFCHAQKCYGAESYIRGFSGYSLELLLVYYKDFKKFLKELTKEKDKIFIDLEKSYKNKKDAFEHLSTAKTHSPIIIIDPTYKERNASSALSKETFSKFKKKAKEFLKSPNEEFFKHKRVDIPHLKTTAQDLKAIYAVFNLSTKKQAGDIAGSKMLKFSKVISKEISKYFEVIEKEYDYWGEKKANMYYVLKRKSEIISIGPSVHYEEAVHRFKDKHRIWYIEEGKIKSARPTDLSIKEFLVIFKKTHKKQMKQMGIKKVGII